MPHLKVPNVVLRPPSTVGGGVGPSGHLVDYDEIEKVIEDELRRVEDHLQTVLVEKLHEIRGHVIVQLDRELFETRQRLSAHEEELRKLRHLFGVTSNDLGASSRNSDNSAPWRGHSGQSMPNAPASQRGHSGQSMPNAPASQQQAQAEPPQEQFLDGRHIHLELLKSWPSGVKPEILGRAASRQQQQQQQQEVMIPEDLPSVAPCPQGVKFGDLDDMAAASHAPDIPGQMSFSTIGDSCGLNSKGPWLLSTHFKNEGGKSQHGFDNPTPSHGKLLKRRLRATHAYMPVRSAYDACMYVMVPGISRMDSLLTVFAMLVSASLEVGFCLILTAIVSRNLQNEDVRELIEWRLLYGHNVEFAGHYDSSSLLAQVCDGTLRAESSTLQMALQENFQGYFEGGGLAFIMGREAAPGRVLCNMCLALWTFSCLKELKNVLNFANSVHHLRKGKSKTHIEHDITDFELTHDDTFFRFKSMSSRRAQALLFTVALPRLAVLMFLLVSGLQFLCYTATMEELILNAVALEFVLQIDDVLFETIVPLTVRGILDKTQPIPNPLIMYDDRCIRKYWSRVAKSFDILAVLSMLCVLIVTSTLNFTVVGGFVDDMWNARQALCSRPEAGEINFVYVMNPATKLVHWARGSNVSMFDAEGQSKYQIDALLQLTHMSAISTFFPERSIPGIDAWPLSIEESSVDVLRDMMTFSEQEAADAMPCRDQVVQDSRYFEAGRRLLEELTGIEGVDCSKIQGQCLADNSNSASTLALRALCPIACGCADPEAGLYDLTGCSLQCSWMRLRERSAIADRLECEDQPASALAGKPGWQRYWRHIQQAWLGVYNTDLNNYLVELDLGTSGITLVEAAATHGCHLVSFLVQLPVDFLVDGQVFEPCAVTTFAADVGAFCPSTCVVSAPSCMDVLPNATSDASAT